MPLRAIANALMQQRKRACNRRSIEEATRELQLPDRGAILRKDALSLAPIVLLTALLLVGRSYLRAPGLFPVWPVIRRR